jgi:hypothetical protein
MVGEVVCVPGITENVIAPSYGHHNRFPFATKKERLPVGVAAGSILKPCRVLEIFGASDGASGNVIVQMYGF